MLRYLLVSAVCLLALLPSPSQGVVTLPKIFKNNMVLQQEPTSAHIWGTTDDLTNGLSVHLFCDSGFVGIYDGTLNGANFMAVVGPIAEGELCNIDIIQNNVVGGSLQRVLFGDVWVCSGQSNMEWDMNGIFNSSEEIAASAGYTNIRMYNVGPHMTSTEEQGDLMQEEWLEWRDPSINGWQGFSAVCFMFARSITQRLGRNKPFGLIGSNWGGTRIEPWSTPEGLAACNAVGSAGDNSQIYNAMIHPLIKLGIKGALWYQGESNEGYQRDLYACTQAEMINTWRARWAANSPTSGDFPFGFVQLASDRMPYDNYECPIIRWHQTYDMGYVPNDNLQNVFMAVSLDTHDPAGGIHPRNKQIVATRLAIAGLNVAYGNTQYPTNGPFVSSIDFTTGAHITYDQDFAYNPTEGSGFYACVLESGFDSCDNTGGSWQVIDVGAVEQMAPNQLHVTLPQGCVGVAYLWNESPIAGNEAAPIYASNEYRLPAAPWKYATGA